MVWGVVCGVACVDCVVLGYVVLRGMFAGLLIGLCYC